MYSSDIDNQSKASALTSSNAFYKNITLSFQRWVELVRI